MVREAEQSTTVAAVGGKVYLQAEPDRLWHAGGKLTRLKPGGRSFGAGEIDAGQHDSPRDLTYVSGALMLIRSNVLRDLGFLDERFFLGLEDYDYCRRIRKAGLEVALASDAKTWHRVGASRSSSLVETYWGYKSNVIFMKKWLWYPFWLVWFAPYAALALTVGARRVAGGGPDRRRARSAILRGLREGFRDRAATLQDRLQAIECETQIIQHGPNGRRA
jgi:GT2 family glycosyltransferase